MTAAECLAFRATTYEIIALVEGALGLLALIGLPIGLWWNSRRCPPRKRREAS